MCSHKRAGENNTRDFAFGKYSLQLLSQSNRGKKTAHNPNFLRCFSRTGKSPILHLEVNFERVVFSNNIMTSASLPTIHSLQVEDFKVGLCIKKLWWVF
jgi:hypothetical protein